METKSNMYIIYVFQFLKIKSKSKTPQLKVLINILLFVTLLKNLVCFWKILIPNSQLVRLFKRA